MEDVQKWLIHVNAVQSAAIFADADVDGARLFSMTEKDLEDLHVPSSERSPLMLELSDLRASLGMTDTLSSVKTGTIDSADVHLAHDAVIHADAPPITSSGSIKKRPPPPPPKKPSMAPEPAPKPSASDSASKKMSLAASAPPIPGNGSPSPASPPTYRPVATICPSCGAEQKVSSLKCKECGTALEEATLPKPGPKQLVSGGLLSVDPGKSILRHAGSPKRQFNVRFDENSIAATHLETKAARGIHARLDNKTRTAQYYLGPVLRNQAAEVLFGAADGAFVIFDSLSSSDHLYLSHVRGGELTHALVENQPIGVCLKRSKNYFETIADLIDFYCNDNDESPNMLSIQAALDAINKKSARGTVAAPEVGYEADLDDYKSTQWYRGGLSEDDAIELIEFEPSGSFVVYNGAADNELILHVVHKGQPLKTTIVKDAEGFKLHGDGKHYETVGTLITQCSKEASPVLPCLLKMPKLQATVTKSVDADEPMVNTIPPAGVNTSYLQTGFTKAKATDIVLSGCDGTFVIRSSESRPGCYVLTYKSGEFAHHELIQCTEGKQVGFSLEVAPDKEFASIEDLVRYFEYPRAELRCQLVRPVLRVGPSIAVTDAAPYHIGSPPPKRTSLAPQPAATKRSLSPSPRDADAASMVSAQSERSSSLPRQSGFARNAQAQASISSSKCVRVDARAAMSKWCCLSMSKDEALQELPRDREGAFVVRKGEKGEFAVLTAIMKGKDYHVAIEETPEGLKLRKASSLQPNLSALIAFYKHSQQPDLPHPLTTW